MRERNADEGRAVAVIDTVTEVRQMLSAKMVKEADGTRLRDMLYLDLGLEAQLRLMAERSVGFTPPQCRVLCSLRLVLRLQGSHCVAPVVRQGQSTRSCSVWKS